MKDIKIIKKDNTIQNFDIEKVLNATKKSAYRVMHNVTDEEQKSITEFVLNAIEDEKNWDRYTEDTAYITVPMMHNIVEKCLLLIDDDVAKSYRDYRNYKTSFVEILDSVYKKSQAIMYIGDKENSNSDSTLASTKRCLIYGHLNKELYQKFNLTTKMLQACRDGYIYIHDMSSRRDGLNCCLADVANVLNGGFEMGNIFYTEPKSLDVAFDVIGDIILSAASQQYGGFTVPRIDEILVKYAKKSYDKWFKKHYESKMKTLKNVIGYTSESEVYHNFVTKIKEECDEEAMEDIKTEMRQGFQGLEIKLNTVASSRGDYPFTTFTIGASTDPFAALAAEICLEVRKNGEGADGKKKSVLFPKLVFTYTEDLHGKGKELEWLFEKALDCSMSAMYPDYLSLDGDTTIAKMYHKYGEIIAPMGCADGSEVITYKIKDDLYVESFERMWNRMLILNDAKGQRSKCDINKIIDLDRFNVKIFDTNLNDFTPVKSIIRNVQSNWCDVSLSNGRRLRVTSDHPFETENRGVVYAKDLNNDDIIMIDKNQYSEDHIDQDTDIAYILGLLLCDGCYDDQLVLSLAANDENDIRDKYMNIMRNKFGIETRAIIQDRGEKGHYQDIKAYSKDSTPESFRKFIRMLISKFEGLQKKNRHIPNEVFSYSNDAKYAFLAGMIDADGYINSSDKFKDNTSVIQIGSTNKELALQQMELAQSLGMPASLYFNHYDSSNMSKIRYRVEFRPSTKLLSFMTCKKKIENAVNIKDFYEETKVLSTVVSVNEFEEENYSYDVCTVSEHFELSGVYSHNCRAFLSPYFERGGMGPADENDKPFFTGRFNMGVVSLHLPMIYAKANQESRDFYEVLDEYLQLAREVHIMTYNYLGELRASTNPIMFCQGGFHDGYLDPHDKIKPLLKYATMSFGFTALNELNRLHNGKSIREDGEFPLEVMRFINKRIDEFKHEDGILYALYGTPAESLCFDGNTPIKTYEGIKTMKELTNKDLVYSFNEKKHKIELKKVVWAARTQKKSKVVRVTFNNGQSVICTPNHPFGVRTAVSSKNYSEDVSGGEFITWVNAMNLKHGDRIESDSDDINIPENIHIVVSVEWLDEEIPVYNIEVEDNHNFFVGGDEGILVHNCGTQVKQFRTKYGIIENVSDREYVSNSFHCHVSEDIDGIEKQDKEARFWNLAAGGRIQYVKYDINYNKDAIRSYVKRAMEMGLYEGVNFTLCYCDDCGHNDVAIDICPKCGSKNITKIERMNGYLSYSRVHGDTRLNSAKMAEIADRKSM